MTRTEDVIDSIDDRLRRLDEEIRTLTATRAALDGRGALPIGRRQRKPTKRVLHDNDGTDARAAAERVSGTSSEESGPAPQRSRVRAKPRRGRKPESVDVAAATRLEVLLSEHGEMTTSALAEHANGSRDQVLTVLRELEAAGRVRRSGQRRSTRWRAITDEERIERRAAELAARGKTAG